jgi:hypothetical protein
MDFETVALLSETRNGFYKIKGAALTNTSIPISQSIKSSINVYTGENSIILPPLAAPHPI